MSDTAGKFGINLKNSLEIPLMLLIHLLFRGKTTVKSRVDTMWWVRVRVKVRVKVRVSVIGLG